MANIVAPRTKVRMIVFSKFRMSLAVIAGTLLLSGCQTLGVDVYQPTVQPSSTPQTAEKAGALDPRTRIGANEHPRIIARPRPNGWWRASSAP